MLVDATDRVVFAQTVVDQGHPRPAVARTVDDLAGLGPLDGRRFPAHPDPSRWRPIPLVRNSTGRPT